MPSQTEQTPIFRSKPSDECGWREVISLACDITKMSLSFCYKSEAGEGGSATAAQEKNECQRRVTSADQLLHTDADMSPRRLRPEPQRLFGIVIF